MFVVKIIMGELDTKKKQRKYLIFAGVAVAAVIGLRYPYYEEVGDLNWYYYLYGVIVRTEWHSLLSYNTYFTPGYLILNKLLGYIAPWQQSIIVFEGAFCVFCVCFYIYKNSDHPFLALLFFITQGTMGFCLTGFRQAIAMSLLLLSTECIKKRKLFPFLSIVLVATTIHSTAIVFIVSYFFANRPMTKLNNLFSWIFPFILLFFTRVLANVGNNIFDLSVNYTNTYVGFLSGIVQVSIYVIIILLYQTVPKRRLTNMSKQVLSIPKKQQEIGSKLLAYNMTVYGLALYAMRYIVQAFERVSLYFSVYSIVALSEVIYYYDDKKSVKLLSFLAAYFSILLFIWRMSKEYWGDYRFFWM
jgi:hypothetical protein